MDKKKRYQEKVDYVVLWLLEFGCSTPSLICSAMQLERKNQGHFFLSLKKSGLVKVVKSQLIPEEIYLLSSEGKVRGSYLSIKAEKYWFTASKIVMSTTVHSFSIQRAIIDRWSTAIPFSFQSERFITHIQQSKRPDALIDENGSVIALEVELTQKSSSRIYLGYRNHLNFLKEGLYQKVLYVFPNEALKRNYVTRFDKDLWPLFVRDKHGKIRPEKSEGEPLEAEIKEGVRARFEFAVQETY